MSCQLLSRHSVRTSWEFSLEQAGISPTYQVIYLPCGRMKVPHLISIRPKECWLATLNASSAIMFVLEQITAARIGVICKSASSAPHFLLARLQGYSFQLVFQLVFPAYTLQLPSICLLPTALKTFCWRNLGILTGTSWHFSDISSDMYALWAHESTSLDINKAKGMLTSNAKRIFCDNVTCFGTNNCCWHRSHLQECFNCSSLLACKASRVQLSTCFPISLSRIHLTASLYLRPGNCFKDILLEKPGNSHWNKLALLQHIK